MRSLFCVGFAVVLIATSATQVFAQPPGTFSLPDVVVTDCSLPPVSISTTEAGGTLGYDFEISFDPNTVSVDSVELGSLTDGSVIEACQYATNDSTPGKLAISIACTEQAFGSGTVALIQFTPVGVGTTALTFDVCSVDEVDCTNPVDGSVDLSGCPAIDLTSSGSGTYGLSPGRVCVGATLTSNGSSVASASTVVAFDNSTLALETCSINPTLSGIGKSLNITSPAPGPGMEEITVSGGATPMADGELFICTFTIAAAVTDGTYGLTNTPQAEDGGGTALPTTGLNGLIGVTSCSSDCNGSGSVDISEVVKTLNLFGGLPFCNAAEPVRSCPAADVDNSGAIEINEVVVSLNQFGAGSCP